MRGGHRPEAWAADRSRLPSAPWPARSISRHSRARTRVTCPRNTRGPRGRGCRGTASPPGRPGQGHRQKPPGFQGRSQDQLRKNRTRLPTYPKGVSARKLQKFTWPVETAHKSQSTETGRRGDTAREAASDPGSIQRPSGGSRGAAPRTRVSPQVTLGQTDVSVPHISILTPKPQSC